MRAQQKLGEASPPKSFLQPLCGILNAKHPSSATQIPLLMDYEDTLIQQVLQE